MKDISIIKNAAECIIKKLERTVENFPGTQIAFEFSDVNASGENSLVLISFIGLEEFININSNEKILIDEKNSEGKLEQVYIKHPFEFNLIFLITFFHKNKIESLNMLEEAVKNLKNDSYRNNQNSDIKEGNKPAVIEVINYDIFKLAEIFKILNIKYNPSIVIQTKIEIENEYREHVNIVQKRNFYIIENKRNLK